MTQKAFSQTNCNWIPEPGALHLSGICNHYGNRTGFCYKKEEAGIMVDYPKCQTKGRKPSVRLSSDSKHLDG
jgi:hypothetical protein